MPSALPALVVIATLAAGCSGTEGRPAGPAAGTDRAAVLVVEMTDRMAFAPSSVTVKVGEPVVWRNVSSLVHTVSAIREKALDPGHVRLPEGAEPFDSGSVPPGGEYSRRFSVRGEYRYVCGPHEAAGMMGRVVVE